MATEANEDPKLSSNPSVPRKKSKAKRKRRRVSKHIVETRDTDRSKDVEQDSNNAKGSTVLSNNAKTESTAKEKSLEYLERWKNDTKAWKFNKKLQSALIRNMYDASFVPKHSFEILISYILPNASLRERIQKEATERAVRYQQHLEGKHSSLLDQAFDKLSEHDKRKEYKRARKMLDALETYHT